MTPIRWILAVIVIVLVVLASVALVNPVISATRKVITTEVCTNLEINGTWTYRSYRNLTTPVTIDTSTIFGWQNTTDVGYFSDKVDVINMPDNKHVQECLSGISSERHLTKSLSSNSYEISTLLGLSKQFFGGRPILADVTISVSTNTPLVICIGSFCTLTFSELRTNQIPLPAPIYVADLSTRQTRVPFAISIVVHLQVHLSAPISDTCTILETTYFDNLILGGHASQIESCSQP